MTVLFPTREAQVDWAETTPRAAWIDTDDLNGPKNALHYGKDNYDKLGQRFAARAIELITSRIPPGQLQPPLPGKRKCRAS